MKLENDRIPPGLQISLLKLGVAPDAMADTIREVAASTTDPIAFHHECGYLRGILATKICARGHHYDDKPGATDEEILAAYRRVNPDAYHAHLEQDARYEDGVLVVGPVEVVPDA